MLVSPTDVIMYFSPGAIALGDLGRDNMPVKGVVPDRTRSEGMALSIWQSGDVIFAGK